MISLRTVVLPAILTAFGVCAQSPQTLEERTQLADSLRASLSTVHSAADSLPILYNVYDLALRAERIPLGNEVRALALRAGDYAAYLDVARQQAAIASAESDEDMVRSLLDAVRTTPLTEDRRQTEVFITACMAGAHTFRSETDRDRYLRRLLDKFTAETDNPDKYLRASLLFTLIQAFSGETRGVMVEGYVNELYSLLNSLPKTPTNPLYDKLNSLAAEVYWSNDEPEKSVVADRRLLDSMNRAEEYYHGHGRPYVSLDERRYAAICRMMRNYEVLEHEEAIELDRTARRIAAVYPEIMDDYEHNPAVKVGKMVKEGHYAEALPMVRQMIDNAQELDERRHLQRQLIRVATLAGDSVARLHAEAENSHLLEDYIANRTGERLHELQILYDVAAQRRIAAESKLAQQNARATEIAIAGVVLAILLMVFILLYFRFHALTRKLKTVNETMQQERAAMLESQRDLIAARDKARQAETEKSQIITYVGQEVMTPLNAITEYSRMILDNLPDDQREYVRKFADIIKCNAKILQSIATDMQEFSLMDSNTFAVNRVPVNANSMARVAAGSVMPTVREGVNVKVEPVIGESPIICTDPRRVESVLMALLSNAAKFTESGTITIGVSIDRKSETATYSVTDTGIGVPADKAEQIFERFERLNPEYQGTGLGLPNCAMIAEALRGSVRLDTSHRGPGARFIFTIPTDNPKA